jgi:RND family efflux transporter MFP subunit
MQNTWFRFLAVLLFALFIATAAYFGYASSGGSDIVAALQELLGTQPASAEDAPPTPPATVPVTRGDVNQTVIAPGQLEGAREQVLSLLVGGQLAEINARPGDPVTAGQSLASLNTAPLEEALELAQLKLDQAEAELTQQRAEAELTVAAAETDVTRAQAGFPDLTAAQVQLEAAQQAEADAAYEYQKSLDREWEPADLRESYRRALEAARDAVQIAEAEVASIQNQRWATSQQVASAEITLQQAQMALEDLAVDPLLEWDIERAQADLDAATLAAPFDGVVVEVLARPGESVAAGQELVVIADVSQGELLATVVEEDLPLVKPGQEVEVYFDAAPDVTITGVVERIVPQRTEGDRALYPVYVKIEELPPNVLPGMTADAIVTIARRENVLQLPRAVVRAGEGNSAIVQVWNGRAEETRTIEIGLRGDLYVEIVSGLEEGEQVVGQ